MDDEAREFASSGAVSNHDLDALPGRVLELMAQIRPHAVRLVDAWKIPDFLLDRYVASTIFFNHEFGLLMSLMVHSALGRYDGKVYEDLFHRAHKQNPLNNETFNPDYRTDEIVLGSGDAGQILAKL